MSATLTAQLEATVRRELPSLDDAQAAELARVVEQLVAAFNPERVYAFGSRARGDAGPDSDVDLLVVVAESDEPGYERDLAAHEAVDGRLPFGLDLLVVTRREFDARVKAPSSLPATVLREGKELYAA